VSRLGGWIRRHRILAAFAAGVLLTLGALAVVGYLVLADQRRSARLLAAALSQALKREVQIERVTGLGPSRVVLRGVRLPADRGWPAEMRAQSVEASGPLLAAARGEAAPVRLLVTGPTVVLTRGGGTAGAAALDGLRQGLAGLLASSALLDVAVTGGAVQAPGSTAEDATFDLTLHKGAGEARGEIMLRGPARSAFTLRLTARSEGDTVRLDLVGEGRLEPLTPWLPSALARAAQAKPVDVRAQIGLEPGDRLAGHTSARLGDLAAIEGTVSLREGLFRLAELRGAADLGLGAAVVGLADPIQGRAELAEGEVSWGWERGGWPRARAVLRVPEAALPASAAGLDVRVRSVEARVALEPHEAGAAARGEIRGDRIEMAGVELAPVLAPLRVDLDAAGSVSRIELAGLTASVLGTPVRATVAYDAVRGRADARLEANAVRLDPIGRRLGPGWLGPTDQLHAGSVRVVVAGLDPRGWNDGRVDTEVRSLALRQPAGEAAIDLARARVTVRAGRATIGFDAERVRGALPRFEGLLHRVDGSAAVGRDGGGVSLARATLVARDAGGREMFQADLGRPALGVAGPIRLTGRFPALERLAPLWPSIARQVTGSGTVELQSPDMGFGTYEGRLALRVAAAELLGGRLSLRDVSADVPLRRGGAAPAAGVEPSGPFEVGELIGYGVVLHDLTARAQVLGERFTLADLRYALYSGEGRGTMEFELAADGPSARAQVRGEGVRVDEFVAAYGIRGGTMTGLLRYDLDMRYRGGRLGAAGRFVVPEGGTVTIELLDRLLGYAEADPTGVVKRALGNLRAFDYKAAEATVRTAADDLRVSLSLQGRERLGIFPPRVREINVRDMPLGFLARQFPGR
jgi:hypothetical protein